MDLLSLIENQEDMRRFEIGSVIISEGDAPRAMYIIAEGSVSLSTGGRVIETLNSGDIFGEVALIDTKPRTATATVVNAASLVEVDRDYFKFLVQQAPAFALHVMEVLARRLRAAEPAKRI